jgi:hypothetical protein
MSRAKYQRQYRKKNKKKYNKYERERKKRDYRDPVKKAAKQKAAREYYHRVVKKRK